MAGTGLAASYDKGTSNSGAKFRTSNRVFGDDYTAGGVVGVVGGTRGDIVRYDTPSLGPISAKISYGVNSLAAHVAFSSTLGNGMKIQARVGGRDQTGRAAASATTTTTAFETVASGGTVPTNSMAGVDAVSRVGDTKHLSSDENFNRPRYRQSRHWCFCRSFAPERHEFRLYLGFPFH